MTTNNKKTLQGVVVSDKMQNSAVVEITIWKVHPIIKKRYPRNRRFIVENPDNKYKIGDEVRISETKPLSRHKRFEILSKVDKKDSK